MATENVKIVDPDNGAGTDYTSLSAWEAGEEKDLQQADEIAIAKCRCTGGSADTDAVVIDGSWNTDADRYIKIWTDPSENYRHDGKWNDSKYRLEVAGDVITIREGNVRIEGLQVKVEDPNAEARAFFYYYTPAGEQRLSYCIAKYVDPNNYGSSCKAVRFYGANETPDPDITFKVWNNIFYDFPSYTFYIQDYKTTNTTVYLYNNTVHNGYVGYYPRPDGCTCIAKNNIAQDCSYGFYGSFDDASDYNVSDQNDAPGANSKNCTVSFVDEANDDFHLASGDTCAKDSGIDLSSDPNLAFSDDIDGETRSGTWDIGADEYVAAGGLIKIMDETVSISETLIRRLYANRFIGETVAITETMPRRGYSNRLIDETVSISEGILRRLRSNRIISETISLAEALVHRAFSNRIINETISISETILRRLRATRIIDETLSISESLIRRLRSIRIINETVSITESFVRSCVSTVVKIMSETVSITETLVRRLYSKRIMDETISISEGILRRLRSIRTMAENISVSEVLNRRAFLTKIINETVSITETFVRSCIASIVKIMNETVSITEGLIRKCTSNRIMQETLSILEIFNRKCKMSKIMAETMSIAETIVRRCRATRVLNETISIAETVARSCVTTLVKIMSETISITETLVKITTLVELAVGKISFQAHRASVSFKKFMAKISFLRKGD